MTEESAMLLTLALLSTFFGATTHLPERQMCPTSAVSVEENLLNLVHSLCRHSLTFQRQSARIGSRPDMTVVVRLATTTRESAISRAWTTFTPVSSGRVRADVWVRPGIRIAEHVGHEFEHIVEWLDGIYAVERRRGEAGVILDGHGRVLETIRAIHVGRLVGQELAAASTASDVAGRREVPR
jgi:hypothetical protein